MNGASAPPTCSGKRHSRRAGRSKAKVTRFLNPVTDSFTNPPHLTVHLGSGIGLASFRRANPALALGKHASCILARPGPNDKRFLENIFPIGRLAHRARNERTLENRPPWDRTADVANEESFAASAGNPILRGCEWAAARRMVIHRENRPICLVLASGTPRRASIQQRQKSDSALIRH